MSRAFDLIVFGASGYTGKYFLPYIYNHSASQEQTELKWALAGRSELTLRKTIVQINREFDICLEHIPLLLADINQPSTLEELTIQTRLIVNCCGPYRTLGAPVIEACLKTKTHYIDVSGEPEFLEMVALKYDAEAKKQKIFIVNACGFDSIPADLGALFVQQQFQGTVNSICSYIDGEKTANQNFNYGTWESLVYSLVSTDRLRELRKEAKIQRLPQLKPKLEFKAWPHKTSIIPGWAIPFLGSDRSIMKRSQRYFFQSSNQRPAQIDAYYVRKSLAVILTHLFFAIVVGSMARFNFTRSLLLKFPSFFSVGLFSKLKSTYKNEANYCCTFMLHAKGWKETLADPLNNKLRINKELTAKVECQQSPYGLTSIALLYSALVLLNETDRMPKGGGVFTTAAAFEKTSLMQQLHKNGIRFEVVSEREI